MFNDLIVITTVEIMLLGFLISAQTQIEYILKTNGLTISYRHLKQVAGNKYLTC